ncbi:MAG: DUF4410 domain-containing protein [candidate division Zixibacteria bacterium]
MVTRVSKSMALLAAVLLLIVSGCAKHYVITQGLEEPINSQPTCYVDEIVDYLPVDTKVEDRPTTEDIDKLRGYIVERMQDEGVVSMLSEFSDELDSARYRVSGKIMAFKKGSGFLRYLIGFGAGSAKLTVALDLVDQKTDKIIYSGSFSEKISSGYESGAESFKRVAKNFAKALRKENEKLAKM